MNFLLSSIFKLWNLDRKKICPHGFSPRFIHFKTVKSRTFLKGFNILPDKILNQMVCLIHVL